MPISHCLNCGKEFKTHYSHGKDTQYCNHECYCEYREKNSVKYTEPENRSRKAAGKTINRTLFPGEVVHHLDKDQENNSEDNLIVFHSQSDYDWWLKYEPEGLAQLYPLPNGTYATLLLKRQVVDIIPEEDRKK